MVTVRDEIIFDEQSFLIEEYIRPERWSQLEKWGVQDHSDYVWLLIEVEELGEVADAILTAEREKLPAHEVAFIQALTQIGKAAKMRLESGKPDRIYAEGERPQKHDVQHEITQVAAVAIAFLESRRRRLIREANTPHVG